MSKGHPISSLDDVTKALRQALAEGKTGEAAVRATQQSLADKNSTSSKR